MKNQILFLLGLMITANFVTAQDLVWSYSVVNTGNISRVTLYAQRSGSGTENVYAFNYGFYYKSSEATILGISEGGFGNLTTSQYNAAVDDSAAENMGWITDGTASIVVINTPPPGLTSGYNRLFQAQLTDGDGVGEDIGTTPVAFLDILFDISPGDDPASEDSVYMADYANSIGFTYSAIDFSEHPVVTTGARLQALPIYLVDFKAEKTNETSSYLTWTTSSEINSSHFVIQRSTDRKSWSTIGKVDAFGNSQIIRNYTFLDENVYNGKDANLSVYYRLVITDLDGQFDYSPIESVIFRSDGTKNREILAYPNPASDGIQVEWDIDEANQPTSIELFDIDGKLVYTSKVDPNSNQEYIDFSFTDVQSGLYLLRLVNGKEPIETKQIVVQR